MFYWFTGVSANNLQCPQPRHDDDDVDDDDDDDYDMDSDFDDENFETRTAMLTTISMKSLPWARPRT